MTSARRRLMAWLGYDHAELHECNVFRYDPMDVCVVKHIRLAICIDDITQDDEQAGRTR
jgi:hypothetical protein